MDIERDINNAWKRYDGYVATLGNILVCKYCGNNMIADEASTHLRRYHPYNAREMLWLILNKLDHENSQLTT